MDSNDTSSFVVQVVGFVFSFVVVGVAVLVSIIPSLFAVPDIGKLIRVNKFEY